MAGKIFWIKNGSNQLLLLKVFPWQNWKKHDTCIPKDMFILQLTIGKATVSESDCFASRI